MKLSALTSALVVFGSATGTFSSPATPSAGLVSLWHADNSIIDSVDGNHGTLVNGATYATGASGQAFSFNGAGQHVSVANAANLNPSYITVSTWFRISDFSANDGVVLVAKDDASWNRQYQLSLFQTGGNWYLRSHVGVSSGFMFFTAGTALSKDQWYHAAMTYDGSTLKAYLNGVLDGSLSVNGPMISTTEPLTIGGLTYGPWNFIGQMDDVSIYNRALSPSEVMSLVPEPGVAGLATLAGIVCLFFRRASR